MTQWIAHVAILVPDYASGLRFYRDRLGFHVEEDTNLGGGKRWLLLAPPGAAPRGCRVLLARAADTAQRGAIGNQTGGRVGFFLYTDNIDADIARLSNEGISFEEDVRDEPYGKVCVFADPFGNRWDLLQPVHT